MLEGFVLKAVDGRTEQEIERLINSGLIGTAIAESATNVGQTVADSLVETSPGMLAERRGAAARGGRDSCVKSQRKRYVLQNSQ